MIQTESTPNPDSIKFLSEKKISAVGTEEFQKEKSSEVKIPFVISGGISSIEDIKKIKSLNNSNIEGIIVGKSIYDGDIKIKELAKEI